MDLLQYDDLLYKSDRLLSIIRHSNSVVAIHRSPGSDRVLTTLLMTLLIRQYGFSTSNSLAWLSMATGLCS